MEAGKLRHRVTIEKPVRNEHPDTGEIVVTWQAVATVWAGVRPLSARELLAYAQIKHQVTHEVTLRYTDALDNTCRLKFGTRTFNPTGVRNIDEKNAELRITAVEVT